MPKVIVKIVFLLELLEVANSVANSLAKSVLKDAKAYIDRQFS